MTGLISFDMVLRMRAGRFWVGFKVDNLQSERNQKEEKWFDVIQGFSLKEWSLDNTACFFWDGLVLGDAAHFLVDNFKRIGGLGAGTSSRGDSSFEVTFISELVAVKVRVIYPVVVIEGVPNWAGHKSAILLLCDLGKSVNQYREERIR
ncbi:uncharacterized protein MELLADRAFT_110072 [Melampsora larici-populina 98AG31]|uniref:Uncharacterized protein n=1 Tax=Melampsora larici-populina (strain 98AG31 / pathotype 3-4-7) TaxID=747676 RepID=F4RYK3_MELLP|nr:uncharacterized protein MELLADRAFT_110072 [Melampsora larici-populina 98AG31]EGG02486.1 hypothetical protein MELLADRAFT_110072 [Melampsora larici-populina 98AG31]